MKVSQALAQASAISAVIPGVSTVTGLINLFLKYVVLPRLSSETIKGNRYWEHLQDKNSTNLYLVALIPVIGNFIIGMLFLGVLFANKAEQLRQEQPA